MVADRNSKLQSRSSKGTDLLSQLEDYREMCLWLCADNRARVVPVWVGRVLVSWVTELLDLIASSLKTDDNAVIMTHLE